jgi:hypothetical protein
MSPQSRKAKQVIERVYKGDDGIKVTRYALVKPKPTPLPRALRRQWAKSVKIS